MRFPTLLGICSRSRIRGARKILISRLYTVTKLVHTAVYPRRKRFARGKWQANDWHENERNQFRTGLRQESTKFKGYYSTLSIFDCQPLGRGCQQQAMFLPFRRRRKSKQRQGKLNRASCWRGKAGPSRQRRRPKQLVYPPHRRPRQGLIYRKKPTLAAS